MKTSEIFDWPTNLSDYVHVWNPNFRDMELFDIDAHMNQYPELYSGFKTRLLFRSASTIFCKR
jgi:hypothetical protein